MYGSVVRSALLPAWVCQLPLAVGLVSKPDLLPEVGVDEV